MNDSPHLAPAPSGDPGGAVVLPDLRSEGEWRRLSPRGIVPGVLRALRQLVVPAAAVIYGGSRASSSLATGLLAGLVLVGATMIVGVLGWWQTRYLVGQSDVRLRKGVVGRQARSVPFERIQDVSLEQGFVPRLLGLVEVRFETGAGGKDELKLAFVPVAEGEALRETVRGRIDPAAAGAGRGVPDDVTVAQPANADETPLFTMSMGRLLTFGLFEFSLIVFAVIAGLVQQFDFLLPGDVWDVSGWEHRLAGPGARLAGLGLALQLLSALAGLGAVMLLGLASGVVRTVARDYRFRLERTSKGFRRRRGLFTRSDVVMPVHRVQALELATGILRGLWGWHSLAFISLGRDAGAAHHVVAPFAQLAEIEPIAREAGFALPDSETAWHRPSSRFRIDRTILIALLASVGAAAALLAGAALVATGIALAGAALAVRQLVLRRFERHAIDDLQLFERTAWLSPRTTIALRAKLHSVELSQGPIARRRGYAKVSFGLAGGRLSMRGVPLAEARALCDAALASMKRLDFSQFPR